VELSDSTVSARVGTSFSELAGGTDRANALGARGSLELTRRASRALRGSSRSREPACGAFRANRVVTARELTARAIGTRAGAGRADSSVCAFATCRGLHSGGELTSLAQPACRFTTEAELPDGAIGTRGGAVYTRIGAWRALTAVDFASSS